jgi:hypothetical protein
MIIVYDMTLAKPKEIATVDLTEITDEFMRLMTKSQFDEIQTDQMIKNFSLSLEEGVSGLSHNKIILSKRAVVSEEEDLTGDLRNFVAERLTKRSAE